MCNSQLEYSLHLLVLLKYLHYKYTCTDTFKNDFAKLTSRHTSLSILFCVINEEYHLQSIKLCFWNSVLFCFCYVFIVNSHRLLSWRWKTLVTIRAPWKPHCVWRPLLESMFCKVSRRVVFTIKQTKTFRNDTQLQLKVILSECICILAVLLEPNSNEESPQTIDFISADGYISESNKLSLCLRVRRPASSQPIFLDKLCKLLSCP